MLLGLPQAGGMRQGGNCSLGAAGSNPAHPPGGVHEPWGGQGECCCWLCWYFSLCVDFFLSPGGCHKAGGSQEGWSKCCDASRAGRKSSIKLFPCHWGNHECIV